MALNKATPTGLSGFRITAARVTFGETSLSNLEPFPAQTIFVDHKTCDVAARSGKTINEARTDRIGHICKHYRCTAADTLQRRHAQGTAGKENVRREPN